MENTLCSGGEGSHSTKRTIDEYLRQKIHLIGRYNNSLLGENSGKKLTPPLVALCDQIIPTYKNNFKYKT